MHINTEDLYHSIEESFKRMSYIKPEDIPDIDLYLDQVTIFMDEKLKSSQRNSDGDDKVMTKAMINNYAKNHVMPAPEKKKYGKEHLFVLIFIYYLKSIISINDIKSIFDPIVPEYFGKDKDYSMEDIFREVFKDKDEQLQEISDDVLKKHKISMERFEDAPEEMKEYLKNFDFVCRLSCEVFVKKLLIEKIVDGLRDGHSDSK